MKTLKKNGREGKITAHIVFVLAFTIPLLAGGIPKANAASITIGIEAIVDSVEDDGPGDGYLDGKIKFGDIITGHYTYESTTLDSNPLSWVGDYEHYNWPCGIYLTVGGFEFQTDPCNIDFLVEIINDSTSGGLHDGYILGSYNNLPISNGASVDHISWELTDYTALALNNSSLPTTEPILDSWQSIFGLRFYGDKAGYIVDATVTSVEIVPEPATLLLLGFGTLFLRKRR